MNKTIAMIELGLMLGFFYVAAKTGAMLAFYAGCGATGALFYDIIYVK